MAAAYLADLRERAARGVKRGKLSTAAEFERLLKRLILPALGDREVEGLEFSHVQLFHRLLADTPAQANAASPSSRRSWATRIAIGMFAPPTAILLPASSPSGRRATGNA